MLLEFTDRSRPFTGGNFSVTLVLVSSYLREFRAVLELELNASGDVIQRLRIEVHNDDIILKAILSHGNIDTELSVDVQVTVLGRALEDHAIEANLLSTLLRNEVSYTLLGLIGEAEGDAIIPTHELFASRRLPGDDAKILSLNSALGASIVLEDIGLRVFTGNLESSSTIRLHTRRSQHSLSESNSIITTCMKFYKSHLLIVAVP